MDIPTIEFQPQDKNNPGVELFELDSLYKRSSKLAFDPFAPHRVQFHHLIYITEGVGTHFIDFNRHPCQAGSFVFINRQQVHAFDFDNQPQGFLLLFTQEFVDSIHIRIRVPEFTSGFYAASERPVLTVDHALKESCEGILSEIRKVTGKERDDLLILQLLFTTLILKLHRKRSDASGHQLSEAHRQQFSHFVSLVEDNFSSTKEAAVYADMMNMTYKTLNHLCKQAARQTPKQLIDAHTILEAKRRLAIEDTQVSQLAYALGFEEVSNFVKYFKKHTLVTPNQFKDSLKG